MNPVTASRSSQVLARGRAAVDPALRAAVGDLPDGVRRVIDFHFGWCDEDGKPASGAGGGKAIRPTLALLSAEAAGGSTAAALPAAVAVELVHNFSLLHDDVMDGDVLRRHRPTAWAVFGRGRRSSPATRCSRWRSRRWPPWAASAAAGAVRILGAAVQALVDGQAADVAFESRSDVSLEECMRMARAKTGALLGCACALGALMAAADARSRRADARVRRARLASRFSSSTTSSASGATPRGPARRSTPTSPHARSRCRSSPR